MTTGAIEVHLLLRVLYTAFAAGVGVSLVFSLGVYGLIRSNDMRRDHRTLAAAGFGALSGIGLMLTIALIVFGLILLTHKS